MIKFDIRSFSDWQDLTARVKSRFETKSTPIYVTIAQNKKRSNNQNRYLWGVAYPAIAKAGGSTAKGEKITVDHIHELCKKAFLEESDAVMICGLFSEYTGSTRELTTIQFSEYVTKIQAHFSQYGIYVPDPNEVLNEVFSEEED